MKMPLRILTFAAVLLVVPDASFAQTLQSAHVTRAQLKSELADLESVGYRPALVRNNTYPDDIIDAQNRLAARRAAEQSSTTPQQ